MKHSEDITEISKAMVKAQGELSNIPKNAENSFFKSNYASLPDGLNILRPILAEAGLALIQWPGGNGKLELHSLLVHTSGQWIEFDPAMADLEKEVADEQGMLHIQKPTPQAIGSAITYLRRYAAFAILNVAGEEDDDGNAASKPAEKALPPEGPKAKPAQIGAIKALVNDLAMKLDEQKAMKDFYQVESTKDLTVSQASDAIKHLLDKMLGKIDVDAADLGMHVDELAEMFEKHGVKRTEPKPKELSNLYKELQTMFTQAVAAIEPEGTDG